MEEKNCDLDTMKSWDVGSEVHMPLMCEQRMQFFDNQPITVYFMYVENQSRPSTNNKSLAAGDHRQEILFRAQANGQQVHDRRGTGVRQAGTGRRGGDDLSCNNRYSSLPTAEGGTSQRTGCL